MLQLLKSFLKKRKSAKIMVKAIESRNAFRYECHDCGAKGGFELKPENMIIQYSSCEYCGTIKGFVIKNKSVLLHDNII